MLVSHTAQARLKVVYGRDDRKEPYQVTNALHKKLAASTAAMISNNNFSKSSQDGYLNMSYDSLELTGNLCPSESFSAQPDSSICSGFLIGPDILVTAGHCYSELVDGCNTHAWVFGYDIESPGHNPTKFISLKDDVYRCKEIIDNQLDDNRDYTIIRLNRPVVGREPLKFRTSGKLSDAANLVVIGHPSGLPTKIAAGGKVLLNTQENRFEASLDTFAGSSGSAVFDAETGLIEGILVQGRNDYGPSNPNDPSSCQVVNYCDENGKNCTSPAAGDDATYTGEVVYRITEITHQLEEALRK